MKSQADVPCLDGGNDFLRCGVLNFLGGGDGARRYIQQARGFGGGLLWRLSRLIKQLQICSCFHPRLAANPSGICPRDIRQLRRSHSPLAFRQVAAVNVHGAS